MVCEGRLASAARGGLHRLVVVVQDGHSVSLAQTGEASHIRLRQEVLHSLIGEVVLRDVVADVGREVLDEVRVAWGPLGGGGGVYYQR